MTNEIKPCPFCGTAMAVVTKDKFSHPGTVGDGKCLLAGKGYFWEHIDWWNTRAGEPTNIVSTVAAELQTEVERLREALNDSSATLCAVRATSVGDDWSEPSTAKHLHDICGETMRLNMVAIKGAKA